MIKDFHIQDFRCLKDFRVERLGQMNLIVGANGVGKTALLDAIEDYFRLNFPEISCKELLLKPILSEEFHSQMYKGTPIVNRLFRVLLLESRKLKFGILLIDDFGNNLHHTMQLSTWDGLFTEAKKDNLQIFATTQSIDCIKAFNQACLAREDVDGVLLRMGVSSRPSDEGRIVVTPYEKKEVENILACGMEIR